MQTTAGSLALLGSHPPKDSFVARKLREAGVVFWVKPISVSGPTFAPVIL